MIFDPKVGALYGDDGSFIKTVSCPLALHPDQLQTINDRERFCSACQKTIYRIDDMSDVELRQEVDKDENICIFATHQAKNITILNKVGWVGTNTNNYPVIQTLRSVESMVAAQKNGFIVLFKDVGVPLPFGEDKFIVLQQNETGEIWWSGDYRTSLFDKALEDQAKDFDAYRDENWTIVRNWFFSRSDQPFPLAAYAVPKDIQPGERVFLLDVIEEVGRVFWNQGNAQKVLSTSATWNGKDFEIDQPEPPQLVG
jgi:hypothetical protein